MDEDIDYPSSDGKRMAEDTLQADWIMKLHGNLGWLFHKEPNVFVAADLLWYPVEGEPGIRHAPDAMVALGRPKGHRGAYLQWKEGAVAPQVVFEVLSHCIEPAEFQRIEDFYRHYGVEEFYWYDPWRKKLGGRLRRGDDLEPIPNLDGWVSPLLGVRFEMSGDLTIYHPNGELFLSFVERDQLRRRYAEQAERYRQQADLAVAEINRLRALLHEKGIDPAPPAE